MRIYIAGKIAKGDWRHDVVSGLRGAISGFEPWPTLARSIAGEHDYVGPFFISDDHGCAHGDSSHGVDASGSSDDVANVMHDDLKPHERSLARRQWVVQRCLEAIARADLLFAWVDDPSAFGTLVEIGHAATVVPVVIGVPPNADERLRDLWFALELADQVVTGATPQVALAQAIAFAAPRAASLALQRWTDEARLRCESPIERRMLHALTKHVHWKDGAALCGSHELVLQHQTGGYRLDFALVPRAAGRRIAIECDGHDFHDRTPEQAARDKSRDRELTEGGWTVLRFTGREITRTPDDCVSQVLRISTLATDS